MPQDMEKTVLVISLRCQGRKADRMLFLGRIYRANTQPAVFGARKTLYHIVPRLSSLFCEETEKYKIEKILTAFAASFGKKWNILSPKDISSSYYGFFLPFFGKKKTFLFFHKIGIDYFWNWWYIYIVRNRRMGPGILKRPAMA